MERGEVRVEFQARVEERRDGARLVLNLQRLHRLARTHHLRRVERRRDDAKATRGVFLFFFFFFRRGDVFVFVFVASRRRDSLGLREVRNVFVDDDARARDGERHRETVCHGKRLALLRERRAADVGRREAGLVHVKLELAVHDARAVRNLQRGIARVRVHQERPDAEALQLSAVRERDGVSRVGKRGEHTVGEAVLQPRAERRVVGPCLDLRHLGRPRSAVEQRERRAQPVRAARGDAEIETAGRHRHARRARRAHRNTREHGFL